MPYPLRRQAEDDDAPTKGYGHVCLIHDRLDLLAYIGPWLDRLEGESSATP